MQASSEQEARLKEFFVPHSRALYKWMRKQQKFGLKIHGFQNWNY
jgi:hypothetical protein